MYPPDVPTSRCSFAAKGGHGKKLLKRIGGQSFGDLGKMMAVMKGNIVSKYKTEICSGIDLVHFYRPHAEKPLYCIQIIAFFQTETILKI
ncbi:hypothetical protein NQ317_016182 [Molorchus minor]|uniref:Uncharacterized protein n=1 Tax=Molorchus minor TaxID=1323400 RepID=A0ABQ9JBH7_9CUCU|nr:hypothetical protein NQ317_016182 [Molorchus minor]